MNSLDKNAIKNFYENIENIWPQNNPWFSYLKSGIEKYIKKYCKSSDNPYILNAGSGGNDYGISSDNMYHVDIAEKNIAHLKNASVASIEDLTFSDGMFDYIICVGSVLNYCDAIKAISQMSRVLKKNGKLILEFDNSFNFEYSGGKEYGKSAAIVDKNFMNQPHNLWIYSYDYIKRILKDYSFGILNFSALHILSAWYYKRCKNENIAAKLAKFDHILQFIPYFKKRANNIILLCRKL